MPLPITHCSLLITHCSLLITHFSFDSLSHQALAALHTLPTPVMLSEAKHLSVSTDCEILHYVQNDIVSEWYVATKFITNYSLLTANYSLLITHCPIVPIALSLCPCAPCAPCAPPQKEKPEGVANYSLGNLLSDTPHMVADHIRLLVVLECSLV